jgi:uncharacterized protein (DUF1684 family)
MRPFTLAVVLPCLVAAGTAAQPAAGDYDHAALDRYHAARNRLLSVDTGWLAVVAMHDLAPGATTFGSAADNALLLRYDGVPAHAGTFHLEGTRVRVEAAPDSTLDVNGEAVRQAVLAAAGPGTRADEVRFGELALSVQGSPRGTAIRVRDPNSPARIRFNGLRWFPTDGAARVAARFTPYAAPQPREVPNVLGGTTTETAVGTVAFSLHGTALTLEAWAAAGGRLHLVFRDATSGLETYEAARFLYADAPRDGATTLDFNYAQNPPCAFSPAAGCPLPPPMNRVRARIAAGELKYEPPR